MSLRLVDLTYELDLPPTNIKRACRQAGIRRELSSASILTQEEVNAVKKVLSAAQTQTGSSATVPTDVVFALWAYVRSKMKDAVNFGDKWLAGLSEKHPITYALWAYVRSKIKDAVNFGDKWLAGLSEKHPITSVGYPPSPTFPNGHGKDPKHSTKIDDSPEVSASRPLNSVKHGGKNLSAQHSTQLTLQPRPQVPGFDWAEAFDQRILSRFGASRLGQRKFRIAFIGTEGSGKTVFVAALARCLDAHRNEGWILDPQNMATQQYVDHVWTTLTSGDWPAKTSPGTRPQLNWRLHVPGLLPVEIRLIDPPGHDLRRLFSDNRVEQGEIPEELNELAENCRSADLVVFLVNLRDYLGEPDSQMRTASELCLKFAFEYVKTGGKTLADRSCVVFTQIDLYRDSLGEHGTWEELLRAHLPLLFSVHIQNNHVPIFGVSAVNATRAAVDPDGSVRRVPANGFGSDGFERLVGWIGGALRELQQAALVDAVIPVARNIAIWAVCLLFGMWLLSRGYNWLTAQHSTPGTRPVVVEKESKFVPEGPWWFDKWDIAVSARVQNSGTAGHITVSTSVRQGDNLWKQKQTDYFKSAETRSFSFLIREYREGPVDWFDVTAQ